jgi:hypothetical protein
METKRIILKGILGIIALYLLASSIIDIYFPQKIELTRYKASNQTEY